MRNFSHFLLLIFVISSMSRCSEADAKISDTRSNAFDKIDKRDKKLFTQEERIESYNKSLNKSESLKNSLSSNSSSGYSGYGSTITKNKKVKKEIEKISDKKKRKTPKIEVNLQFSAYSTN